jgi:hypothetical protein
MSIFVVDVEADGPCPGKYSMVSFGAVRVKEHGLGDAFFGQVAPISDLWIPEALAVSNVTRDQHLTYPDATLTMKQFADWVSTHTATRPVFVSDNPAFDWQFINYYFHTYGDGNPFGWSARRVGDFWAGLHKDWFKTGDWRRLAKSPHTHNPVDDATGIAEALLAMAKIHHVNLPK